MSTLISNRMVLSPVANISKFGIMGFQTNANEATVSATSETMDSPISNIVNPATSYRWSASSTATQSIYISNSNKEIDYIGIASHNLAQLGLTVSIYYDGILVVPAAAVSDNQAILFALNLASPATVELRITGATTIPQIAVLYCGLALRLERSIYVGHTPITMGRDRKAINGVSENGQYLGEAVLSESFSTSVRLQNLTPAWYRSDLDPYFAAKPRVPCFYAWRPDGYADEVGYCWVEGNPRPVNSLSNGMMSIDWTFRGLA